MLSVFATGGRGGGSGVVISPDGYALTNFHVVQGNGAFMKCGMVDGELYDCVIVGIDPTGDVALIKLLGRADFPSAILGDSDLLEVGQSCFVVGNPFLLATDFQPSVSWGMISGIHRYQYPSGTLLEYADCIQTDAAINPGNSGGPLFNSKGELVGINGRGSFEKRGRVNVGVGYAISINQIKLFMDHLRSGRLVDHATLGATVATNERGEVRVANILESSDAYRRGLRLDDEILSFAGQTIRTTNQLKNAIGIYPKGWRVPLTFRREGNSFDVFVRLAGVHAIRELVDMIQGSVESKQDKEGDRAEKDKQSPSPPSTTEHEAARETPGLAGLFEKRRGFANYYFNLQNRRRIWSAFREHGNFGVVDQKWRMIVEINGVEAVIVLGDRQSGLQTDDVTIVIDNGETLSDQMVPFEEGGYLTALHLWRRMLTHGPAKYGDVFYLGSLPEFKHVPTEPRATEQSSVDHSSGEFNFQKTGRANVLSATHDVIQSNFFFDKKSHQLVSMEMFVDVGSDPCELYFSDYQVHDDLKVPGTVYVAVGNRVIKRITIKQIEFVSDD